MGRNEHCTVVNADVIEWARTYQGEKFHALLADPPYHLTSIVKRFGGKNATSAKHGTDGAFTRASAGFMGKQWDGLDENGKGVAFRPETWAALSEHLHPGAFIMAFGGSRTYHRLACAIEDAGFIIHPAISWVFGSGFPKATNLSKAIDREAGAEREILGTYDGRSARDGANRSKYHTNGGEGYGSIAHESEIQLTVPATDLAKTWSGHRYGGQALKPAAEFICVAQKPYEGRAIDSITATGAGALNIDSGRIAGSNGDGHWSGDDGSDQTSRPGYDGGFNAGGAKADGRWPSNLIIDRECAELLDAQSGTSESNIANRTKKAGSKSLAGWQGSAYGKESRGVGWEPPQYEDEGGASRFFFNVDRSLEDAEPFWYCAKAGRDERNAGLERLDRCEIISIYLIKNVDREGIAWAQEDLKATLQVDTAQSPPRVIAVSGTQGSNVSEWNMFLFGNEKTGRSLSGCKSITATGINSITESKILNWLMRSLTDASIVDANFEMASGKSHAANAALSIQSLIITSAADTVFLPGVGHVPSGMQLIISAGENSRHSQGFTSPRPNHHPCCKPISLCKYLAGLLLPPDAYAPRRMLIPFAGSGSEAIAAMLAGWEEVIGIEAAQEYVDIAEARIAWWHANHFGMFAEVGLNQPAKIEPQHSLDLE